MSEITIPVALGDRSYNIEIAAGMIQSGQAAIRIAALANGHRILLVTHSKLKADYCDPILEGLLKRDVKARCFTVPSGERSKTLKTIATLYDAFLEAKLDRKSLVVAVGGGVLGDMVGFAAATYLRGIAYAQVPTTLLAQVDSSVGGKTGVDLPQGKNLIGAFHQPCRVLIDPDTLDTLPTRELKAGMAEIIKYGIIYDTNLFDKLTRSFPDLKYLEKEDMAQLIARSCEIKAEIVSQDETEQGLRAILNFGHTIGHALEAVTGYRVYKHGEAVAIGMAVEARIGEIAGVTPPETRIAIFDLLKQAGLPTRLPPSIRPDTILQAAQTDKKTVDGKLHFLLPRRIGEVVVSGEITDAMAREALQHL